MTNNENDIYKVERPVNGDITRSKQRTLDQRTAQELIEEIDKVLTHPDIEAVILRGYTPYFNDGDACVYGASVAGIIFKEPSPLGEAFESDEYYGSFMDDRVVTEYDLYTWSSGYKVRNYNINGYNTEEVYHLMTALDSALVSGVFDFVMQSNFGDHAEIKATSEGFEVEFFEHD